ncbi:hypothetical protein BD830_105242 [Maritimibacter alkaliphilus HTCC2654]|uniref:Terminase large subunit gp17-like C-terminal domain-containing protein n=1 Tax=Maritimibacter alkaliphilus HTCC2654 TaxID=314271 RepID=A3VLE8_9RHOB|nr:hypothetical protein [Maritimibacter alkaliphilus]EAQ10953.1 hypothetical protein RB2654_04999 [Rhodobacterales bacterium HTCC2654] [Maritimibacter alkaliphilus HTCC2654]TYP81575.1 hypothetical protein BD830_105242 [Maritimibacter alkaliphilus HTCC2654]
MQPELVQQGEDLILPSSDPAVTIAKGYRRYLVGFDIAQSATTVDANAFAIIQDERIPHWTEYAQELGPRRRTVVRAERVPAMSYTELGVVVRNLMRQEPLATAGYLVVDSSGVGRAFSDLLLARSVQHTRMQITSGEGESEAKERGVTFNNVSKSLLLNSMNSALHVGDLKIGNFPLRNELQRELESFSVKHSDTGRSTFSGGTKAGHADIAMSVAMALWLSDHRTVGAHVGETRLKGYWD